MNDVPIKRFVLSPAYEPLFADDFYIALVSGGRYSGKSFIGGIFAEEATWQEGERIIYTRYTKTSSDISVKDELKEKIDMVGHTGVFKTTNNRVTNLETGSDIIFVGMKTGSKGQTAAVKSIKDPTILIIEEAEEIPSADEFWKLVRSFRKKDAKIRIILLYNPPDDLHWIWEEFFTDYELRLYDGIPVHISKDPRVLHIHTTYLDNLDNLNEEVVKNDILYTRKYKPEQYKKKIIGTKGSPKTGKEFYHSYRESTHVGSREIDYNLPVHISFDQNVVPYIYANLWQVHYENDLTILYCFDEIAIKPPNSYTEDVCKEFIKRHGKDFEKIYLYGDASGNKRDTRVKTTDYKIVKRILAEWVKSDSDRVFKANPPVAKRGDFTNNILEEEYNVRIVIDPSCRYLQTDLDKVLKDANGGKLKEKVTEDGVRFEPYGHPSDCQDYFVVKVLDKLWKDFTGKKKKKGISKRYK